MEIWNRYLQQADVEVQGHRFAPISILLAVLVIVGATVLTNLFFIDGRGFVAWLPALLVVMAGILSLCSLSLPRSAMTAVAICKIFATGLYISSVVVLGRIVPYPHSLFFWMLYLVACEIHTRDSHGPIGFLKVIVFPLVPLLFFPPPGLDIVIIISANIIFFLIMTHSLVRVRRLELRRWETEYMLVRMAQMAEHIKSQMQVAHSANLGLVAHDLKNQVVPLAMANESFMEVLSHWRSKREFLQETFASGLRISQNAVESIMAQMDELLHEAAVVQGRGKSFTLYRLQQVISNLERGLVYELHREDVRKLTDVVEVSSFPTGEIPGNLDDLQLIFINLIQNAVTAGATRVSIAAHEDDTKKTVRISVTNNGRAISPDLQKVLFVPFCTTEKTGTGVGLYFARQWLESIGGGIDLGSTDDTRTTFLVTLPLKGLSLDAHFSEARAGLPLATVTAANAVTGETPTVTGAPRTSGNSDVV